MSILATEGLERKQEVTYDLVAQELDKLGAAALPHPKTNNYIDLENGAWSSTSDKYRVMKIFRILLARNEQIDQNVASLQEKRIDPLRSGIKVQKDVLSNLEKQEAKLNKQIAEAEAKIQAMKKARVQQIEKQETQIFDLTDQIEKINFESNSFKFILNEQEDQPAA